MKLVPQHIREIYGSAHRFRKDKRALIRELETLLNELRRGAAYFPGGHLPVDRIAKQIAVLKADLSVKNWGR